MDAEECFRGRTFTVNDPDARIRSDGDLMAFVPTGGGKFQTVPMGTRVKVIEVKLVESGSRSSIVFGRTTSEDETVIFGWTSTRNFDGKFMNQTIGVVRPELGAGRFGPNAAWSGGEYLGQVDLVAIVDSKLEIERIALNTVERYLAMVTDAEGDSVVITLNSGFRSFVSGAEASA